MRVCKQYAQFISEHVSYTLARDVRQLGCLFFQQS